jgi:hypothetical protein
MANKSEQTTWRLGITEAEPSTQPACPSVDMTPPTQSAPTRFYDRSIESTRREKVDRARAAGVVLICRPVSHGHDL